MLRPWYLDPEWEKKASKYHITKGSSNWDDYVSTVHSLQYNSFRVPCIAGFVILGIFALMVVIATLVNGFKIVQNRSYRSSSSPTTRKIRKHISQAPLFGYRHNTVYRLASDFLTVQAPLRGEALLLACLCLANLIPLVAFYSPYTTNNIYYPNAHFYQIGRYLVDRAAILAVAQLPILILFAGRNNPVSFLTGMSFATSMVYHRWIARLVTLQILIHAIGYSFVKSYNGGLTKYKALFLKPYFCWGISACILLTFLCFFSLRWFRRHFYEWFVLTHVTFAIVATIGIFYHIRLLDDDGRYADFTNYVYASITFWCLDKSIRLVRIIHLNGIQCSSTGTVRSLCHTSNILSINIQLKGKTADKWLQGVDQIHAGSFVQIWIPRLQPLSSHPFSVASIHTDSNGKAHLQLYAQMKKGITQQMLKRTQHNGKGKCEWSIMVEGFYGNQIELAPFGTSILVAGGIGITSSIGYLQDAITRGKNAHLVWFVPSPDLIAVVIDVFKSRSAEQIVRKESKEGHSRQFLSIYITRPLSSSNSTSEKQLSKEPLRALPTLDKEVFCSQNDSTSTVDLLKVVKMVHPLLDVQVYSSECRPDVNRILEPLIAGEDTSLFCCGPAGLLDAVRNTSRLYGLNYHGEAFGW